MGDRLADSVVLVTGASAGIGQASVLALAGEGARLVVTARRQERLDELVARARAAGGEAVAVIGDARDAETAQRCVAVALDRFGQLDILVNNAGVGNYKNLVDTSPDEYDDLMDSNVRSTFVFSRYAAPPMIERGTGTILMISSMAGIYGFPG